MRVIFMGTPDFAVPTLRGLALAHDLVGVFTRPDAVSGRGSARKPSPVKQTALELGLPVFEPSSLRDPAAVEALAGLAPDVIVVAAYGMILPRDVLAVPRLGCINVHASLLPRWRGAAPIQWAIIEGDAQTGVSIMQMEEGLDTGPFCRRVDVDVAEKTQSQLTAELAHLGAGALLDALGDIETDRCVWVYQDEAHATYARKICKADVALSPELSVMTALRRVRASSAHAPSRALVAGRGVTVCELSMSCIPVDKGSVRVDRSGLILGLKDGAVEIRRVKPDGKAEMDGVDWARGLRVTGDEQWEDAL